MATEPKQEPSCQVDADTGDGLPVTTDKVPLTLFTSLPYDLYDILMPAICTLASFLNFLVNHTSTLCLCITAMNDFFFIAGFMSEVAPHISHDYR